MEVAAKIQMVSHFMDVYGLIFFTTHLSTNCFCFPVFLFGSPLERMDGFEDYDQICDPELESRA